ncbi:MAG: hypothetical protein HY909_16995 [Deltaproteobacteria bacterium]|nr:hypothetical protein [Deltaproteobacteria bacterium]
MNLRGAVLASALIFTPVVGAQTPPGSMPPPPPSGEPAPSRTPPVASGAPVTEREAWPTAAPRRRRPSLLRERLRLLDDVLLGLVDVGSGSRITTGIIDTAVGGLLIGIGFALEPGPSSAVSNEAIQTMFWVLGGFQVVSGVARLAWTPARERLPSRYAEAPQATAADRRERARLGEEVLDRMASDGRLRRVLWGLGGITIPLATLGVLYAPQLFDDRPFPEPQGFNVLLFAVTALQVGYGVAAMFERSEEERLRDRYHRELQSAQDRRNQDDLD